MSIRNRKKEKIKERKNQEKSKRRKKKNKKKEKSCCRLANRKVKLFLDSIPSFLIIADFKTCRAL